MKFPIAAVATIISLASVSAIEIDFNNGWEWRYGDEKEWRAVDLPHDFMIESPWDESANHSQRVFKPLGEAFYKKSFQYDPSWEGKRVLFDFGGIMFFGDVKVNGKKVAETEYGYLGFETDITEQLKKDAPNVVEVWAKVGGGKNGSRWYTGGGLYRSVKLKVVNERRIARHGVCVRTKGDTAKVEVELEGCRGLGDELELIAEAASCDGVGQARQEPSVRRDVVSRQRAPDERDVPRCDIRGLGCDDLSDDGCGSEAVGYNTPNDGCDVPDATTEVKVAVEGAGRLLALDDGDHSTDLLFNVDTKKMKEGYLLAIIRRTGDGDIVLSAKKSGEDSSSTITL